MTAPGVAPRVAVVDYGIGNLHSAHKSFIRLGADARLTADPAEIGAADAVVLPGVGAFGACMTALRERRLDAAVLDAAASGRPFLGICVGLQMLFDHSVEHPDVAGLGVFTGTIEWIPPGVKRPQMQWNQLTPTPAGTDDPLFAGLFAADARPWFYFVHSLHAAPSDPSAVIGTCDYGATLNVAVRRDNVVAVQFNPEKSAADGLRLLDNFLKVVGRS